MAVTAGSTTGRKDAAGTTRAPDSLSVICSRLAIRHDAAVPDQRRYELDNALLLAVLSADTKFAISDSDKWYNKFETTLEIGAKWVADNWTWRPVPKRTKEFDIAAVASEVVAGKGGKEAAAKVATAHRTVVDVRKESVGLAGVLRFGLIPSPEAAVILACSRPAGTTGSLTVNLAALAYQFTSGVDVDDVLRSRPWGEVSKAFGRSLQYTVDTTDATYEATQKDIADTVGKRVSKYVHRTPIVS